MDVNEYMNKSLALLERIAEGIETMNEHGVGVLINQESPTVGAESLIGAIEPGKAAKEAAEAEATLKAKLKAAEATLKAAEDKVKADAKADAKAKADADEHPFEPTETKVKRATADEARTALKAFAAVEGNAAAQDLLTSFEASSISALSEASTDADDKLAKLIAKCKAAVK